MRYATGTEEPSSLGPRSLRASLPAVQSSPDHLGDNVVDVFQVDRSPLSKALPSKSHPVFT
jgi:hypothetical protein